MQQEEEGGSRGSRMCSEQRFCRDALITDIGIDWRSPCDWSAVSRAEGAIWSKYPIRYQGLHWVGVVDGRLPGCGPPRVEIGRWPARFDDMGYQPEEFFDLAREFSRWTVGWTADSG